jgi:lipoprotein-anchoring transpeptidase ErfK/SrfK
MLVRMPRRIPVLCALALSTAAAAAPPAAAAPGAPTPSADASVAPRETPALAIAAPSKAGGATVARIVETTKARRAPGSAAGTRKVSTQTAWSRQPQTLLALEAATADGREWVKVLLADRPNGSTGWVPRDSVVLERTPYWVDVRTGSRRVTVYRSGRRVRSFRAVVGARRTPTPTGLAAIYERNRQPNPRAFLGPWALSLTSLSNVLESYGGGPGRVAIHGRAGASLKDRLGTARSHGCVRVTNADVSWMAAKVPVGTPVDVRR